MKHWVACAFLLVAGGAAVAATVTPGTDDAVVAKGPPSLGFPSKKLLCSQSARGAVIHLPGNPDGGVPLDNCSEVNTTAADYCTGPGHAGIACKTATGIDPSDLPWGKFAGNLLLNPGDFSDGSVGSQWDWWNPRAVKTKAWVWEPGIDPRPMTFVSATDPVGGSTAWRGYEGPGTGGQQVYQVLFPRSNYQVTLSVYAKYVDRPWLMLHLEDVTDNGYTIVCRPTYYNLQTGEIGTDSTGNTSTLTPVAVGSSIPGYGIVTESGWYLATTTRTITSGLAGWALEPVVGIQIANGTADVCPADRAGDITKSQLWWHPMLSVGEYLPYVPALHADLLAQGQVTGQLTNGRFPVADADHEVKNGNIAQGLVNGYIGIGTTNPSAPLHLIGDNGYLVKVEGLTANRSSILSLVDSYATPTHQVLFGYDYNAGITGNIGMNLWSMGGDLFIENYDNASKIRFQVGHTGGAVGIQRAEINENGLCVGNSGCPGMLGVGTSAQFGVDSSGVATMPRAVLYGASGQLAIQAAPSGGITTVVLPSVPPSAGQVPWVTAVATATGTAGNTATFTYKTLGYSDVGAMPVGAQAHLSGCTATYHTGTGTGTATDTATGTNFYVVADPTITCSGTSTWVSGSGTAGKVAAWAGPTTLGDSIIDTAASGITITGNGTYKVNARGTANGQTSLFSIADDSSYHHQLLFGYDPTGAAVGFGSGGSFLWTYASDLYLMNYSNLPIKFVTNALLRGQVTAAGALAWGAGGVTTTAGFASGVASATTGELTLYNASDSYTTTIQGTAGQGANRAWKMPTGYASGANKWVYDAGSGALAVGAPTAADVGALPTSTRRITNTYNNYATTSFAITYGICTSVASVTATTGAHEDYFQVHGTLAFVSSANLASMNCAIKVAYTVGGNTYEPDWGRAAAYANRASLAVQGPLAADVSSTYVWDLYLCNLETAPGTTCQIDPTTAASWTSASITVDKFGY